jgi:hypothetical protein
MANFFGSIFFKVIICLAIAGFTYGVYWITIKSLRRLKSEVLSYYPFDLFFPQGGTWSVSYFLIVVLLLGLMFYLLSKGNFGVGPA